MFWSGYDTSILITGILTMVLAVIPGIGTTNQTRAVIGAVGAGLVVIAIITGNLQSFEYPSLVTIAPAFPVVAGVIMVIRARNVAAAERQSVEVGAQPSPLHGSVDPSSGAVQASSPGDHLRLQAADPATPRATLADLAYDHPELRAVIAANPSAYPGLLEWLRDLDDPVVTRALDGRQAGG